MNGKSFAHYVRLPIRGWDLKFMPAAGQTENEKQEGQTYLQTETGLLKQVSA